MATDSSERAAQPGELCTCGRQAVIVYVTDKFGEVGYCGIEGAAENSVLPCPWCGSAGRHEEAWGGPTRCPQYTLRPPAEGTMA